MRTSLDGGSPQPEVVGDEAAYIQLLVGMAQHGYVLYGIASPIVCQCFFQIKTLFAGSHVLMHLLNPETFEVQQELIGTLHGIGPFVVDSNATIDAVISQNKNGAIATLEHTLTLEPVSEGPGVAPADPVAYTATHAEKTSVPPGDPVEHVGSDTTG